MHDIIYDIKKYDIMHDIIHDTKGPLLGTPEKYPDMSKKHDICPYIQNSTLLGTPEMSIFT
jgi:hypothetical protein